MTDSRSKDRDAPAPDFGSTASRQSPDDYDAEGDPDENGIPPFGSTSRDENPDDEE